MHYPSLNIINVPTLLIRNLKNNWVSYSKSYSLTKATWFWTFFLNNLLVFLPTSLSLFYAWFGRELQEAEILGLTLLIEINLVL